MSFIASLDVGTTTIRCQIIDSTAQIVGSSNCLTVLVYPQPGFYEIHPDDLWTKVVLTIKNAIEDANLSPKDIKALGISTQRSTFITWYKDTGEPFHNFITWKDIRTKELCKELNKSSILRTFRYLAYCIYLMTRNKRFLAASRLTITPNHVSARLLWVLNNIPKLKQAIIQNNVCFGTVDTWLLYRFTNKQLHVTDITNASATAIFDPFTLEWGSWAKFILRLPLVILPKVVDNDFDFGVIEPEIFGHSIPIKCVMGDQSSSMFASCTFNQDDLKLTLGTGAFLNVNTGNDVPTSVTGMYPLVGWKIDNKIVYIGESPCNDCGSLMQWLLNVGLLTDPSSSERMAQSVENSDGVYFIPAFSGLGPPINDARAASGFLGIKPTTTNNHLVRAVLESIVYRAVLAYKTLKQDRPRDYKTITIDGGVSRNNFICQLLADLTGLVVERLESCEMSALGVALVAGLKIGLWHNEVELRKIRKIERIFQPNSKQKYSDNFNQWLKVIERFKLWYND